MTLREKLKQEHPEKINEEWIGVCFGCPHEYKYAEKPDCCRYEERICTNCWNREMEDKMEKTNLQKAFAAVGVDLEIGQRFEFAGLMYKMVNRHILCGCTQEETASIGEMINHPENIKPLPTYSPETIEHARHDIHRFGWVARNESGEPYLYERKPKIEDEFWACDSNTLEIPQNQYPEVKPSQCVALEEIVGGAVKR